MKQIFTVCILLGSFSVSAQKHLQDSIAIKRATLQRNNMYVLGVWAGANILQGSISANNATGSDHYFHQMNVYWNVANLAIATAGFFAARKQLSGEHSFDRNLREQHQLETVLALNGGLDIAYIMTGLYLKERGHRLAKDQPTGYGNSLLLQGGFLLIFDLIQYLEHRHNGKMLEKMPGNWQFGPTSGGLGLAYRF
jgi:hypothetical protein